ncbi:MAG TPA: DUF1801 domain-containing protein [Candidatus Thermoplasmatota archaeon]|nr:DUF1801 domain-containing protein [Candidatus Thermoplasmatota archaeon]
MRTFSSVEEYIAAVPAPQRAALERLRAQIRRAAPRATEKIAYGIPTFVHHGNLVHFAAFQEHCSFFPGRAGVALLLRSKLHGYETNKGTIRFTPDRPLPASLVREIVKMRVAENEARGGPGARTTARGPKKAPSRSRAATRAPRAARK